MAKKLGGRKSSTSSLSPLAKKSSKGKATGKRRKIAYKQEYIKLLEETNKLFRKEIKSIRKEIEKPKPSPQSSSYEAFPKEEKTIKKSPIKVRKGTVQEQILQELAEISHQIKARDKMFDDLINSSPRTDNTDYFNE